MLSYKVKVEWMKLWAIVGLTKEKSKSRSKYHFKSPPSTNIKHIQTKHQADALPHHQAKKISKKKKKNPTIHIWYINIIILFTQYYSLSQSNRKTFKHKIFKENIFKKYGNIQEINLHNADNRAQNNIHLHIENDSRLSKLATMANTAGYLMIMRRWWWCSFNWLLQQLHTPLTP